MARRSQKRLSLLLLPLLAAVLWLAGEWFIDPPASAAYAYQGWPRFESVSPGHWTRIFVNRGYATGYSEWFRGPLWVAYRLPAQLRYRHPAPRSPFRPDTRSLLPVHPNDYTGSGYDRGHLAPSRAIGLAYGPWAQRETFLMSNISPQRDLLNQRVWERLEDATLEQFRPRFEALWIVSGPLYVDSRSLPTALGVRVPNAYFCVLLGERQGNPPHALAFLVPQSVNGQEPLEQFLDTVDDIERLTGLDFFPDMDRSAQHLIESRIDGRGWGLTPAAVRTGSGSEARP